MLLCLGVVGYGHKEKIVSILLQSLWILTLPYLAYGSVYRIVLLEFYDYCRNIRLVWYEGNIGISLSCWELVHYGVAGLCIVVGQVKRRLEGALVVVLLDAAGFSVGPGNGLGNNLLISLPCGFKKLL